MNQKPAVVNFMIYLVVAKLMFTGINFVLQLVSQKPYLDKMNMVSVNLAFLILMSLALLFIYRKNKIGVIICLVLDIVSSATRSSFILAIIPIIILVLTFTKPATEYFAKEKF